MEKAAISRGVSSVTSMEMDAGWKIDDISTRIFGKR